MASSATNQSSSLPTITAGERKTSRSRHSQDKIDRIMALLSEGKRNMDIAAEVGVSREAVCFYRAKTRREGVGLLVKYDPATDKRVYETDVQAETFAALMAGQSFHDNVRTKTFGRQHHREPAHVMTESNIARCG